MRSLYRGSAVVLNGLLLMVGVAMVVSTIARGGGPLTVGVLFGTLFALLGAGRLYLAIRLHGPRGRA